MVGSSLYGDRLDVSIGALGHLVTQHKHTSSTVATVLKMFLQHFRLCNDLGKNNFFGVMDWVKKLLN